jgi:hypothetical protein
MKWLTGAKNGSGRRLKSPEDPAVAVRVYLAHESSKRLTLMLNPAIVQAMSLQRGDRLMVGIAGLILALVKHKDGNAISGDGFSEKRDGSTKGGGKSTPYVSYNLSTYPDLQQWADRWSGQWVHMTCTDATVHREQVFEQERPAEKSQVFRNC